MIQDNRVAALVAVLPLLSTPAPELLKQADLSTFAHSIERSQGLEERYRALGEATIDTIEVSLRGQMGKLSLEQVAGERHLWVGEYPVQPHVIHTLTNPSTALQVQKEFAPLIASNPNATLVFCTSPSNFPKVVQAIATNAPLPKGTKVDLRVDGSFDRAIQTQTFEAETVRGRKQNLSGSRQDGNETTKYRGYDNRIDIIAANESDRDAPPVYRHAQLEVIFDRSKTERGTRTETESIFGVVGTVKRVTPYIKVTTLPGGRVNARVTTHSMTAVQSLIEQEHDRRVKAVLSNVQAEIPATLGMEQEIALAMLRKLQTGGNQEGLARPPSLTFSSSAHLNSELESLSRGLRARQYDDFEAYLSQKIENAPSLEHAQRVADLQAFRDATQNPELSALRNFVAWEDLPISVPIDEVIPFLLRRQLENDLHHLPPAE